MAIVPWIALYALRNDDDNGGDEKDNNDDQKTQLEDIDSINGASSSRHGKASPALRSHEL